MCPILVYNLFPLGIITCAQLMMYRGLPFIFFYNLQTTLNNMVHLKRLSMFGVCVVVWIHVSDDSEAMPVLWVTVS